MSLSLPPGREKLDNQTEVSFLEMRSKSRRKARPNARETPILPGRNIASKPHKRPPRPIQVFPPPFSRSSGQRPPHGPPNEAIKESEWGEACRFGWEVGLGGFFFEGFACCNF